jgi:hypothetical protein
VYVLKCGDENDRARPGNLPPVSSLAELGVAGRERGLREGQIELAIAGGQVPDAGGPDAARGEVVVGQRDPCVCVCRIGDQPALQLVERGA